MVIERGGQRDEIDLAHAAASSSSSSARRWNRNCEQHALSVPHPSLRWKPFRDTLSGEAIGWPRAGGDRRGYDHDADEDHGHYSYGFRGEAVHVRVWFRGAPSNILAEKEEIIYIYTSYIYTYIYIHIRNISEEKGEKKTIYINIFNSIYISEVASFVVRLCICFFHVGLRYIPCPPAAAASASWL